MIRLGLAAVCVLFLTAAALALGGEPPRDLFFPAVPGAKPPRAGEWLEYVVAYPGDPLEQAIREMQLAGPPVDAAPSAAAAGPQDETAPTFDNPAVPLGEPTFDPEPTWQTMRLRLEILKTEETGCRAMMTYAGLRHEVFLPFVSDGAQGASAAPAPERDIEGDLPPEEESLEDLFAEEAAKNATGEENAVVRESIRHWLGERSIEVELERRNDPLVGYTRLVSAEVPFGVVRMASEYVDLILVDQGVNPPPDFPSRDIVIEPPPGQLHH